MPRLDRTGPVGEGKMTGRGLGRCTGQGPESLQERPSEFGYRIWRGGKCFGANRNFSFGLGRGFGVRSGNISGQGRRGGRGAGRGLGRRGGMES